jgi:hypothetical protein
MLTPGLSSTLVCTDVLLGQCLQEALAALEHLLRNRASQPLRYSGSSASRSPMLAAITGSAQTL